MPVEYVLFDKNGSGQSACDATSERSELHHGII